MSMPQPQLTLAANTLRWDGRGYEMVPAPSNVLLSAYCDAMQTSTFSSSYLTAVSVSVHILVTCLQEF